MIPILILKIGAPKSDSLIIGLVLKMSALALKFLEKKIQMEFEQIVSALEFKLQPQVFVLSILDENEKIFLISSDQYS